MDPKAFWKPYTGAVSLTFDDGEKSQLDRALPLMDELLDLREQRIVCPKRYALDDSAHLSLPPSVGQVLPNLPKFSGMGRQIPPAQFLLPHHN